MFARRHTEVVPVESERCGPELAACTQPAACLLSARRTNVYMLYMKTSNTPHVTDVIGETQRTKQT
jgi:hypothetical protein